MARSFASGSSEYLQVVGVAISGLPCTMACWVSKTGTDWSGYTAMWHGEVGETNEYYGVEITHTSGVAQARLVARSGGVEWVDGSTFASSEWHHLGAVFLSTTDRDLYLDGSYDAGGTNNIGDGFGSHDQIAIGRAADSSPGGYMNGGISECAMWSVALSAAEMAILGAGYSPLLVRPQSLVFYAPLIESEDRDMVGGLLLTAYNTPTIAPHPPITYPSPRFLSYPISSGSTEYYSTPAGALTFAGTTVKQPELPKAGALTFTGLPVKQTSKSYTGALTFVGTVVKQGEKALAGALTFAGTVVKQAEKVLAGALTFAGVVVGKGKKVIAGAVTFAGVIGKAVSTSAAGALTFVGSTIKKTSKAFAGALTFAGTTVKKAKKIIAGALSHVGTLATNYIAAGGTAYYQVVAGASTFAGSITKKTSYGIAGVLTFAGSITKKTKKAVSGALSFVGALLASLVQAIKGILYARVTYTVSVIANPTPAFSFNVNLSATESPLVNISPTGNLTAHPTAGGEVKIA